MAKRKGQMLRVTEITAGLETVTVDWARETLLAQKRNRPMKMAKVKTLAKIIRDEKWVTNGESIILDENGILIDGQHRLAALVHAIDKLKMDESTTIDAIVVRGISPHAFHTIDQGEKRSLADVVAISEYAHSSDLAVALRLLAIRLAGKKVSGTGKMDHADNLRLLRDHDNLASWVEFLATIEPDDEDASWLRPQSLISIGYLAAICYLASLNYETDRVEEFVKRLINQDYVGTDCPAVTLRKALLKNRSDSAAKLRRDTLVSMVVKAMSAYLEGEKLAVLKLKEKEHPVFASERPQDGSEIDSEE